MEASGGGQIVGLPSAGPEAEGDQVPGGQENGQGAASQRDEQGMDADGGMNLGARDAHDEPQSAEREQCEKNCSGEKEYRPKAECAELIERLYCAENGRG